MTISLAPRHALAAHRGRLASMAVLAAIAMGLPGCVAGSSSTMAGSGVAATQTRTVAGSAALT